MNRELRIVVGPDKDRHFPLEDGQTLVVGRGQASHTQINDPSISRVHCQVQVDGGTTRLMDRGSSSGTWVGEQKIEQHDLQPGEVFRIGNTEIQYLLAGSVDATTVTGAELAPRPKPTAAPLQTLVGQSMAHFRLDSIIAAGNSGMVFRGHDTEKDRAVAIKVLTPDANQSEEQKERFIRAMKTMLPVKHPHIVRLYNAGKSGTYLWAAMELVEGESMVNVIERIGIEGMLDWREAYRVAVHIARALHEAFERNIIHRNVTPPNILRRHSDKACLLGDLMIAKATEGSLAKQVTQPGQMIGDVPYMSPERTRDQAVDHRSDLYGLGATLYAILTGKPPFESNSLPELVRAVRQDAPRPPKDFQLSTNDLFQDAVMQLLAKDPADRYQTPADLLGDLERIGKFNNLEADWNEWVG